MSNLDPYKFFSARDGLSIRYGCWPCGEKNPIGTVVLLTGRREFLEKYAETISELHQRNYDVFGMDWRGQGLSARQLKNRHKGYVDDYACYLEDLEDLMQRIVQPVEIAPLTVLAHSMGAHIAMRYLHDHRGTFQRVVLTSPMVDILLPLPFRRLLQQTIRLISLMGMKRAYAIGTGDYKSSRQIFEGNRLTSDPKRFRAERQVIAENPDLALGGFTYGWLDATFRSIDILTAPGFAAGIKTPVLMLSAEKDRIVSNNAQRLISSAMPNCTIKVIPGALHEILVENDSIRARFWQEFDRFVTPSGNKEDVRSEKKD